MKRVTSDLQKAPLAEASVTLKVKLFSVLNSTVFMIMAPYTMGSKSSVKNGQRLLNIEKDCVQTTELLQQKWQQTSILTLKTPFSQN